MKWTLPALLMSALLLCACSPREPMRAAEQVAVQAGDMVQDVASDAGAGVIDVSSDAGKGVIEATAPVAIAIAEVMQPELPAAIVVPPPPEMIEDPAVPLIVRWEVTSKSWYERKLSGIYCPPPPSGPTGGIGYDFGHQTPTEIRRVWGWHPEVDRLVTASGQIGALKCEAWAKANRDIRVTWDEAVRVFSSDSLPKYRRLAIRALPGLDRQTLGYIGGLTSNGYRRGWSMDGERNREKRVIKNECVPANNAECAAIQVAAMCRIWVGKAGGKGQCNRSNDEAALIRKPYPGGGG